MNINEAVEIAKKECKDPYAQAYLQAIPKAIDLHGSEGFDSQLLYTLANMSTWRGEQARNVKAVFKSYLKSRKLL